MEESAKPPHAGVPVAPFIAADIGGTHARFGLLQYASPDAGATLLAYHEYRCAAHAELGDIVNDFLRQHASGRVADIVLACSGYLFDGVIINDTLPWRVSIPDVRRRFGFSRLLVLNDFEALGYATRHIRVCDTMALTSASAESASGVQVLVGPGTGLGTAAILADDGDGKVMASEAGQIALAPGTPLELAILGFLLRTRDYVSSEDVLSGRGLVHLYQAICAVEDLTPTIDQPEDITAAAIARSDDTAVSAMGVFFGLLGSYSGDMALLYGANGGIWLAGGILPHVKERLVASSFVERFCNKGSMRTFLQNLPIRLVDHGKYGVIGAGEWYRRQTVAPLHA